MALYMVPKFPLSHRMKAGPGQPEAQSEQRKEWMRMNASCQAAPRTVQALLPQVVDSFQAQGFSCRHRLALPSQLSGGCVQLLCARQSGRACLSTYICKKRPGAAQLLPEGEPVGAPVSGLSARRRPLPAETTVSSPCRACFACPAKRPASFAPQLQLRALDLALCCGCLELCYDFCVVVYALCQALVCLPCPSAKEPDCSRFFSMPLYPGYRTPPC